MNKTELAIKLTGITKKFCWKIEKHSPEITFAAGVVTFAATVVMASKATITASDVIKDHKKNMDEIEEAMKIYNEFGETEDIDYDPETYRKEKIITMSKTAVEMVKLYTPALMLGGLSIALFLKSKNIVNNRYLSTVAAYNGLHQVFSMYRKRVVDEYGKDMDRHFRYGTTYSTDTVEVVDENGKKHKEKVDKEETIIDIPNDDTSRVFCQGNPNWDTNPNFNLMFLRQQQNYWNDKLRVDGHVVLNDVYDSLGFPHTSTGGVVGWIKDEGDNCVDFGITNIENKNTRRFINGDDNAVLLEFNHQGIIINRL